MWCSSCIIFSILAAMGLLFLVEGFFTQNSNPYWAALEYFIGFIFLFAAKCYYKSKMVC